MNRATEISDRDLIRVRLRFLDLLKSFFQDEPDAERMSRWRGIFAAIAREQINPQLDAVIIGLGEILNKKDLQELKNEYYALFTDPYSNHPVPLNASHYLDGKDFGPSLVSYRELLKTARLIKDKTITESEDTLLIMLDTLVTLIEEEKSEGAEQARDFQNQLLQQFLFPTARQILKNISSNTEADFYKKCTQFLCEYLELEQGLLEKPGS
jgi:TorA maturation chaperone TorD